MKYLLFASLLLSGCHHYRSGLAKDPHWQYLQEVTYSVPEFYKSVCNGKGVVQRTYRTFDDTVIYVVQPYEDPKNDFACYNANNSFSEEFAPDEDKK